MLSGEKLINNKNFLKKQLEKFPAANGGEMEAAALYEASRRIITEWIVIKGICDWAHKKSDKYQKIAARASSSLIHFVLNDSSSFKSIGL